MAIILLIWIIAFLYVTVIGNNVNESNKQKQGHQTYSFSGIYSTEKIDNMEGHEFEYWCADILRRNGYCNVTVTRGSGDQGVDVLAERGGIKYAVQCKRYSSDLSNTPIQEVYAGKDFYGCQIGVVMTNSHFTKGARELAEKTGVLLWDREELIKLASNSSGDGFGSGGMQRGRIVRAIQEIRESKKNW